MHDTDSDEHFPNIISDPNTHSSDTIHELSFWVETRNSSKISEIHLFHPPEHVHRTLESGCFFLG